MERSDGNDGAIREHNVSLWGGILTVEKRGL